MSNSQFLDLRWDLGDNSHRGMYLGNYVFQILLAFVREYQVVSLSFLIKENHPSLADRDYEVVLSKLRFFAIFYFCILSFSCLT